MTAPPPASPPARLLERAILRPAESRHDTAGRGDHRGFRRPRRGVAAARGASAAARPRGGCARRQRERGLGEEWLRQIPEALDVDLTGGRPVLLHTEIMRDHLLVEPDPAGGWRFSGLIDFEPAMRGAAEYELVGVGCFVAEGDSRFLARFLRAYGHPADDGFPRRMMAWSLLHRYSNLPAWMRRLPAPDEPTFEALARRWFGTG